MSFKDIINTVRHYPEIWQASHPGYNQRVMRKRAWKQITKQLNGDELHLKKRWKHLMDHYRKEIRRISGRGIPSGWQHFEELSFLSEEMVHRTGVENNMSCEAPDNEFVETSWSATTSTSNTSDPLEPKLEPLFRRLQTLTAAFEKGTKITELCNDEDYMFFLSIMPMMKSLSNVQKLQLRGKINEWLLQALSQEQDSFILKVEDNGSDQG